MRLTTEHIIKNADTIFHQSRWSYGIVVCPYCGSVHIHSYPDYHYKCNSCKRYFSDKTRTLLHHSKLSTSKWMLAMYEVCIDNRISSTVLSKKLGINQKSAWLMLMKIRFSMSLDDVQLNGTIAQDEMYLGGCLSNFHYGRKQRLLREQNLMGENDSRYTKSAIFALNSRLKQPVFGMTDGRGVVLRSTPNPIKKEHIRHIYKKHVHTPSVVVSDESKLYEGWEEHTGSVLYTNNHHNNQYTVEGYSSNRIENVFSWFKRGFVSRVVHCKPQYAQLYLNEFCFRYNTRHLSDSERFNECLFRIVSVSVRMEDIRQYDSLAEFSKKKKTRHIYTMSDIKTMFDNNELIREIRFGKTVYRREDF